MIGQLFAQSGDLLGRNRAGTVPPLAPLISQDVGDLLVVQRFVPWLHDRRAVFLSLHGPCKPFKTIMAGRRDPPVVNSEPASGGY